AVQHCPRAHSQNKRAMIPLLPQPVASNVQPRASWSDADAVGQPQRIKPVVIFVIYMVLMLMAQRFVADPAAPAQTDKPSAATDSTVSSQTPPPNADPR
ncbi:MAG: hypothetical protein ABIS68_12235, partial [Casimicrobiaceae bacterium]